jgi:hypothetical protein
VSIRRGRSSVAASAFGKMCLPRRLEATLRLSIDLVSLAKQFFHVLERVLEVRRFGIHARALAIGGYSSGDRQPIQHGPSKKKERVCEDPPFRTERRTIRTTRTIRTP